MGNIRIDANAAQALAEFDKLVRKENEVADGQDKIGEKSRSAAADERRLGNLRAKLLRETDTAQEKFKRRLTESAKALKGVENSEKRLGRVRDKLTAEYLEDLRREKQELGEVGDASEGAFNVGPVDGFVGGLVSVGAATSKILEALSDIRAETKEAAAELLDLAPSSGSLVQLAGADRAKRDALFDASDKIFASGGVRSREEANQLTFELDSGNLLKDLGFFSQLAIIDNASELAKSVGLINEGFRGGDAVGDSVDVVSKAFAGASPATGVSPSQIAEGVAISARSAARFDLTDEELFAAVSRVAQSTGSGTKAGTQVNSLLTSLTRRGLADELRGEGFGAILNAVEEAATTQEELVKFLGNDEAAKGFGVLQDRDAFRARVGEIGRAQAIDLASLAIGNALDDPRIRTAVERQAAEALDQITKDDRGVSFNSAETDLRLQTAFDRADGRGEVDIFFDRQADSLRRFVFGDERAGGGGDRRLGRAIEDFRAESPGLAQGLGDRDIARLLIDEMRENTKAAKETTQAVKSQTVGIPIR